MPGEMLFPEFVDIAVRLAQPGPTQRRTPLFVQHHDEPPTILTVPMYTSSARMLPGGWMAVRLPFRSAHAIAEVEVAKKNGHLIERWIMVPPSWPHLVEFETRERI